MSYPTVNFLVTSAEGGVQPIAQASDVQMHPLGKLVRAQDATYGEGEFIYLKGAASTAAGDVVCFDSKTGATVRAVAAGATSVGPCGVAMAAIGAGNYGWYQISGSGPVNAATVATNGQAFLTSTAGQVDDTGSSEVSGLLFKSADSGGFATAQMDRPTVVLVATGVNTGDVTLAAVGSAPNANGASLAGQVLTLQPANGTTPGLLTAAAQAIGGQKTFGAGLRAPDAGYGNASSDGSTLGLSFSGTSAFLSGGQVNIGSVAANILRVDPASKFVDFSQNADTKFYIAGSDSSGTPGAATVNKACGRSAVASGAGSVVVTDSCVGGSGAKVFISPRGVDTAAPLWKVTTAAGSFTVTTYNTLGVATNVGADWVFDWFVINPN